MEANYRYILLEQLRCNHENYSNQHNNEKMFDEMKCPTFAQWKLKQKHDKNSSTKRKITAELRQGKEVRNKLERAVNEYYIAGIEEGKLTCV